MTYSYLLLLSFNLRVFPCRFYDSDERVICVVRAIESEKLQKEALRVTPLEFHESILKLNSNDEAISRLVNMEKVDMETEFQVREINCYIKHYSINLENRKVILICIL